MSTPADRDFATRCAETAAALYDRLHVTDAVQRVDNACSESVMEVWTWIARVAVAMEEALGEEWEEHCTYLDSIMHSTPLVESTLIRLLQEGEGRGALDEFINKLRHALTE